MISWSDVNTLQSKKKKLEASLTDLFQSSNPSPDEISSMKAEIKHLDKQIERILGTKEIERQKESKRQKLGIEQINIKRYYSLKDKYKKVSKMKIATTKMIAAIENYQKNLYKDEVLETKKSYEKVKM